jgi:radical SAM-linked protein
LTRIRIKYSRTGRIRFLSHLDFMNLFHRAAVRTGVPIAYSQGFNPHPRIAFGPALSVGMESGAEYLDMETDPFVDLLRAVKDLNKTLPEGIRVLEARVVPKKAPSLSGSISRFVYETEVPAVHTEGLEETVGNFLSKASVLITRDGKQKDIRPGIESIALKRTDGTVFTEIILHDSEQVKPRVQDVVEQLFDITHDQALLLRIKRVAMFWNDKGKWADPMDVK